MESHACMSEQWQPSEAEREESDFKSSRAMARAGTPLRRGFVDPDNEYCPLAPLPDPDTDWERWARYADPVTFWSFHRTFFMAKTDARIPIRAPSLFTNPELYAREGDLSWHPVWGFTPL